MLARCWACQDGRGTFSPLPPPLGLVIPLPLSCIWLIICSTNMPEDSTCVYLWMGLFYEGIVYTQHYGSNRLGLLIRSICPFFEGVANGQRLFELRNLSYYENLFRPIRRINFSWTYICICTYINMLSRVKQFQRQFLTVIHSFWKKIYENNINLKFCK